MAPDPAQPARDAGGRPSTVSSPVVQSKRLTVDLPADLHLHVKLKCVRQGMSIADAVRELLAAWAATEDAG